MKGWDEGDEELEEGEVEGEGETHRWRRKRGKIRGRRKAMNPRTNKNSL